MAQGTTREAARQRARRNGQPPTKEGWAALAVHTVTCPSGYVVKISFPSLETLLARDAVPQQLQAAAYAQNDGTIAAVGFRMVNREPLSEDDWTLLRETHDLGRWLVTQALVEPAIETVEELNDAGIPARDVEMIQQLVMRERDTDALGVRLGVVPLSDYERFLREYECTPGCEACARRRAAVPADSED